MLCVKLPVSFDKYVIYFLFQVTLLFTLLPIETNFFSPLMMKSPISVLKSSNFDFPYQVFDCSKMPKGQKTFFSLVVSCMWTFIIKGKFLDLYISCLLYTSRCV